MEEFEKVTYSERKILEYIRKLKPFEEIRILADSSGKPDTFFYEQSTRIRIQFGESQPIKDIWKK